MKKLTNAGFIRKAMMIWGDRYDFRKTAYLNMRTNVVVTCRLHGDFETRPGNFIYNRTGCPTCGGQRGLSNADFISKAKRVHGDNYDYSLVRYVSATEPVEIICGTHGVFSQKPTVHLTGAGCQKCGKVERLTTETFVERAKITHKDRYDYSSTKFKKSSMKVEITCPKHGKFQQLPHNHLSGRGCPICGNAERVTTKQLSESEAIERCSKRGFTLLKYAGNATDKSLIMCINGHEWESSLSKIQQGIGCPACAIPGYNPYKRGFVYALKSEDGKYMKIGLSNKPAQRIKTLVSSTPFKFGKLRMKQLSGFEAPKEETRLHKMFASANLTGFDGCTEWFIYDEKVISEF